ncbi:probable 2-oxoglutarate-dependent dioxygenase AOP1 [Vitis vinifera]|uniref:probable 2-oxoglutarate-dependent dioxygenase AOP1 n=1 Tax=Vitis vinifera TaxID=29760 RepID=UPI002883114C|nr:probable 2-oxoglutarate-dependent dioxygenase AOP1 [Vitis vinifera]
MVDSASTGHARSCCRTKVRLGLEEYGCFTAAHDKIPLELHNTNFSTLEELFDLPKEIKVKNTNHVPFHSYLGQISSIPLHEALCINDATNIEEIRSFTNLMWPAGNYRFCAHLFSKLVAELDQMVIKMLFESYGEEKYSDSHIGSTTSLLRPLKYRAPKMMETNLGLNSHKDKSFMTILQQNQVDGLEIETKDGEWICF